MASKIAVEWVHGIIRKDAIAALPSVRNEVEIDPEKEDLRRLAGTNLLDFIRYTCPHYRVNWHHRVSCNTLDELVAGRIKRLMIFEPPRHGKTERVSRRLPAYLLGRNPDAQIIACSYSADLSSRNNRDVQRIIDSHLYQEVFPQTTLYGKNIRTVATGSYLRNSEIFEIVNHTGSYRSAGVGGGITGMGFGSFRPDRETNVISGVGIIDDPFKNRQEAESLTIRESVWEWYTSTFRTRAEGDAAIVLIMTRWHEDDLAGRLLRVAQEDPKADQWDVLQFPAIAEGELHPLDPRRPGESLWEEKYGLDELYKIKASVGSYDWSALFQQRPSPESGNIFDRNHWQYYQELPARPGQWVMSVDAAFKDKTDSDFVVIQVWFKHEGRFYLVDQVRDRMSFTATVAAIRQMVAKHPRCAAKLIEDKANGSAVIDTLKLEIPGLIPINPTDSKVARARAISPFIEAGNVFLPQNAAWVGDFVEEMASFPNGANDDQCDALSQALRYMQGNLDTAALLNKILY